MGIDVHAIKMSACLPYFLIGKQKVGRQQFQPQVTFLSFKQIETFFLLLVLGYWFE